MRQLSGTDNVFLQMERGNTYMHIAGLSIYDPSSAPGGHVRFKDVLRFFAARVEKFPVFRQRLVSVPMSLDRPYWIEDPALDVEFHVRHIALPHPGDWRQLCIQVARLHSRPLDRSKPLWEAYVIEGLHNVPGMPRGSFALYVKFHHAMMDGEAGTEIIKAIHSPTPEIPPNTFDTSPPNSYERDPGLVELYSRSLVQNLRKVPELARWSFGTAGRLASLGAGAVSEFTGSGVTPRAIVDLLRSGDLGTLLPKMPPPTRFSGKVSAHRVFEAIGLPLSAIKTIRQQVDGVTVNDVFLAVIGGALRHYLADKGELPEASLTAMVPMTLRGSDKLKDEGNQVGMTMMPVHSNIADPVARLEAIHVDAQAAKRSSEAMGKTLARDLLDNLPNVVSTAVTRNIKLPKYSLVVSNVRGPDLPMYMAGARLMRHLPVSIIVDGIGLNCTAFSYDGTMWLCAISCRNMLPDPAFLARCLQLAFDELVAAAAQHGAAAAPVKSRARAVPRRRPAKKTKPAKQKRARA